MPDRQSGRGPKYDQSPCFGIEVLTDLHATDLGIIMNNGGTIAAIADWFDTGMPYIDGIVTVSGPGIEQPSKLIVPLGTPVREVLRYCGGLSDDTQLKKLSLGGPMMGPPHRQPGRPPSSKAAPGSSAFTATETVRPREYPCIRCGRCLEACSYFLNPSRLARLAKSRMYEEMKRIQIMECVECDSCTYACPSGIPIVQLIRTAKRTLRSHKLDCIVDLAWHCNP